MGVGQGVENQSPVLTEPQSTVKFYVFALLLVIVQVKASAALMAAGHQGPVSSLQPFLSTGRCWFLGSPLTPWLDTPAAPVPSNDPAFCHFY